MRTAHFYTTKTDSSFAGCKTCSVLLGPMEHFTKEDWKGRSVRWGVYILQF